MGTEAFNDQGWRVPFLLSAVLVAISVVIRMKMKESPLFSKIKAEGKISKNPLKESFGNKENLKLVLIALFGAAAGQGVVWYTGQFYAMTFIEKTCNIEFVQTRNIIAIALLIGTPLFVYFGWWSDRVGRKLIMMLGLLLAVFLYRPIYKYMYAIADVREKTLLPEQKRIDRSLHLNDAGDSVVMVKTIQSYSDGTTLTETETKISSKTGDAPKTEHRKEIKLDGENYYAMIAMVLIQVVLVSMVYGPIAAFLVELFPTRIRYTSMSLPYHIGNGVFGGLTPFIATSLYEMSKDSANPGGDPFAGLLYPIAIAAITFVIGMIFLSNRKKGEVME
jgi:MHS family proline/betaine transporter-like MFS transporter